MKGQVSHFNAFYIDNSILIQFMIEEFIRSYQLHTDIQSAFQEQLNSPQNLNHSSSTLVQLFNQLVGSTSIQNNSTASSWSKGPLTKFKEYCELFSRNTSHQNNQNITLHLAANHAWLHALYSLELANFCQDNTRHHTSESQIIFLSLKQGLAELKKKINQIYRFLPRYITPYQNNENVVLCLLRRKELLDKIYATDFINKQLKWSMNISDLKKLLLQRYKDRGFVHLLPMIQELLGI